MFVFKLLLFFLIFFIWIILFFISCLGLIYSFNRYYEIKFYLFHTGRVDYLDILGWTLMDFNKRFQIQECLNLALVSFLLLIIYYYNYIDVKVLKFDIYPIQLINFCCISFVVFLMSALNLFSYYKIRLLLHFDKISFFKFSRNFLLFFEFLFLILNTFFIIFIIIFYIFFGFAW